SATSCGAAASAAAAVALPCCQGCQPRASLQVLPPSCDRETSALRAEMEALRAELSRANTRVQVLLESERHLKDRLASVASAPVSPCGGALSGGERLVRCYANLYTSARVDALDALDNLPPLKDADELKSKILFSVVVLAFRAAQSLLLLKKDHVRRVLHIPPPTQTPAGASLQSQAPSDPAAVELELSVASYLRRTVDNFDLSKSCEEVLSQIWATLYDYPCLKNCPGLVQYVKDAVRLAWSLVNQTPPYVLEYEQRMLRKDVHVRFHSSNQESDQIRTYLWPALLEGTGGPCVHKAVVIT
ncbi:Uncharacterized protein GBIM_02240, partial [Gryllus bimaculatus]